MIRLRILQILDEQNHTKYWLYKRMDMLSYRNFKNIVENETSSIRFETLDKLSRILNVPVGDLFEQTEEERGSDYPLSHYLSSLVSSMSPALDLLLIHAFKESSIVTSIDLPQRYQHADSDVQHSVFILLIGAPAYVARAALQFRAQLFL